MANEYDKIFKENIEELLPYLAHRLLGIDANTFEELPDDLQTTVERKPDFLKRVNPTNGTPSYLLHIEFQSAPDAEMPYRMNEYYAMLLRKYRTEIRQYVLQLGRPVSKQSAKLQTAVLRFHYQLINLREIDYAFFLNSSQPGEILLAVLGNFHKTPPQKVLAWLLDKLRQETEGPSHRFEKYANQLLILSKLRNLDQQTFRLLEDMPISLGIEFEDLYSFKKGEQKGKQLSQKETILNLHQLNVLTVAQIAKAVGVSVATVKRIIQESQSAAN